MKFKLIIFFSLSFVFSALSSPLYFSLGGSNLVPIGKFKEVNKPSLGFNFHLQDRTFCNLWYGLRVDFAKLDSLENVAVGTNYFASYFLLSPEIRYVFVLSGKNNYDDTFYIFLQGLLNYSSISRKQKVDENNNGLGGSAGAGLGFGFILFNLCWAVEFDALFSAPNFILKSDRRPTLTNYNFGLTLGVRL